MTTELERSYGHNYNDDHNDVHHRIPGLKCHATGLYGPLHDHDELKLLLGEVGGVEVEKGRVLR